LGNKAFDAGKFTEEEPAGTQVQLERVTLEGAALLGKASFHTAGPIPTSWVTRKGGKRSPKAPLFTIFQLTNTETRRVPCLSRQINLSATDGGARVPLDTGTNGLRDSPQMEGGVQRAVFAGQSVATAVTTLKHTQHPTALKHNFQRLKDNPCTHK